MENELIKITTNEEGKRLVSARDLHEFLGIKSKYADWIKNRISKYDFIENEDYILVTKILETNNPKNPTCEALDHGITVEMGKELSMVENNDKGKQARKYFIECEKQLVEVQDKAKLLLSIYSGGQEGILASKKLTEIEVKEATKPLLEKIETDKPLVEFSNTVLKSADNILVRELSKVAFEQGMDIGEKKLYKKLREWKYIMQGSTEPYQSALNQGLFLVEENPIKTPYGVKISKTTKVTPKGQVFIIEKLRKELNR